MAFNRVEAVAGGAAVAAGFSLALSGVNRLYNYTNKPQIDNVINGAQAAGGIVLLITGVAALLDSLFGIF
jgi:hypothetical protein